MALCAFSLLLFVIPTDKMSPGSRNTPKDLKSYMKCHHINGVMLVSGKDGTPVVVENNETTNNFNKKSSSIGILLYLNISLKFQVVMR